MKQFVQLFIVINILSFSCASVKNEYGRANIIDPNIISIKPTYRDSAATAVYIGGSIGASKENGAYNREESFQVNSFNAHIATTKKNFNASIGGYGFWGDYQTTEYPGFASGDQSFKGYGINGNININLPFDYLDWRLLGLNLNYQHENGDFFDFRRRIANSRLAINGEENAGRVSTSLYSELIWKHKFFDAGLTYSLGLGNNKFASTKIFATYRSVTLFYQNSSSFEGTFNYNFDSRSNFLRSHSFGLRYQIFKIK